MGKNPLLAAFIYLFIGLLFIIPNLTFSRPLSLGFIIVGVANIIYAVYLFSNYSTSKSSDKKYD
ncbi:hypothetical protein [Texcoconibacillus texcoconensis]|uniref:Uncharacterized membrane protein YuzA (DUF378 family) n=1 Tax=Texcoconibacillus texcoconensis TaxID=1095777 RepID=A0A840QS93_9BACI|nr:hypothetical protein [Texcoconibacillus texcoconensis]MBB5174199.1 uncharacterized membrane protein YuzA (DUF378 family) [Texcoconibacillus texcoconensis]